MKLKKIPILICFLSLPIILTAQSREVDVWASMNQTKKVDLAEITPHLNYIRLSSGNNNALIGRIRRITANDSFFIIYDDMSFRLMVFDKNGLFIKDLMRKGKGPNEFIGISSIDIRPNNDILILKNCEEIVIMNPDGVTKEQFRIKGNASSAIWLNNSTIILLYPYPDYLYNDGFEISFVGAKGKVLSNTMHSLINNIDYNDMRPYFSWGWNQDTLYYWNQYRDTIYSITQDYKVFPRLILKHGKQRYSLESVRRGALLKPGFSFELGYLQNCYYEFRNKRLMGLGYKDRNIRLLYDPITTDGFNLLYDYSIDHFRGFKNNLDGGMEFWPSTITCDGDMIMTVDPNELRETFYRRQKSKELVKYPNQQDSLKINVIDKITLMDNPVLIKIKK